MAVKIQIRRGTAANWTSANPTLSVGELALETDTGKIKVGTGSTAWTSLPYVGMTPTEVATAITNAISGVIDLAPSALDTLNELAAAINDDPNFFNTISTSISAKQDKVSGVSDTEIGYLDGVTSSIQTQLNAKASSTDLSNHASDTTNIHGIADTSVLETQSGAQAKVDTLETEVKDYTDTAVYNHNADTTSVHGIADTSQLETQTGAQNKADSAESAANSYTDTAIANLIDSSPTALNTLNELAAALGDDPNFASTITTSIGTKATLEINTSTNWTNTNPVVPANVFALESNTGKFKIGNGVTAWTSLAYAGTTSTEITNLTSSITTAYETYVGDALTDHNVDTNIHGISNTQDLAYLTDVSSAVSNHNSDTTSVHGISNTANLAYLDSPTFSGDVVLPSTTTIGSVNSTEISKLSGLLADSTELNILNGATLSTSELNVLDGITASTAELNILDGVTVSATELNILNGATVSSAELNVLDGITASTAELNTLDGIIATTEELNILNGVTANASELNVLDGITASTVELNKLDGVTASTAELNILTGVTATAAELNTLDGITASTAELNLLDGITASTVELNYVDGVTSSIQTQLNSKASSTDLSDHASDTTNVHGIADTSLLETQSGAQTKADAAESAANTYTDGAINALDTDDIEEGVTNLYFTNERAQDAIGGSVGNGLAYNDTSGAVSVSYDTGLTVNQFGKLVADTTVVATLSGSQTLTNKTIDTADNNITVVAADISDITASASELNVLDGITTSTAELNYVDGVTSSIQDQLDAKLPLSGGTLTGALTLHAGPTSDLHAATKAYVDGVSAGINFHQPVVAATAGNLAGTYDNGTNGFGATLTKASNGSIGTIDGATVTVGSRILVRAQTDAKENGIYTVTAVGSGSAPWQITRATDADNNPSGEMAGGDFCFVTSGNTYANTGFILSNTGSVAIGTDNVTYTQFNAAQAITAGYGLTKTGGTLAVDETLIANLSGPTFTGNVVLPSTTSIGSVSGTEIGYLDGVTSPVQTQLDDKQATITGAASTVVSSDLTADRAVLSNGTGKIAASSVTATELGYVSGVTSAIQTQIDGKQATVTGAATTITGSDLTASRALTSNSSGKVAVSAVTSTELGYVSGVTSAIQTQLDAKAPIAAPTFTGLVTVSSSGVAFSDGTQTLEGVPSRTVIIQQTSSYTLTGIERDDLIEMSSTSAITLTIPTDSTFNFPVGTSIDVLQTNTGQVTIAGAGGVTVNATPGLKLRTRWSSATLFKRAANTWVVYGDLTA